ncbi:MAG: LytR C-terminal domain-containing protein [marine benthic group bacterium]|jgi:hypothetical protein|nr:LytR C-terminal domain-containing protein [Candidatus Benthicola marisminoris]
MIARMQTVLVVLVLLGAGVLLGSFLLEWRGRELAVSDSSSFDGLPSSLSTDEAEQRISVEVLNGAGEPGAAARITDALRDAGYDVKTFGNAPSFEYEVTIVIDRSERSGAARSVADALGVDEVRLQPEPALYLDATIILGRDWQERLAAIH